MRRLLIFLALFTSMSRLMATHNRAGEITYKRIAPFTKTVGNTTVQVYTYSITVIKYTNDGPGIADRCVDTVYFGDSEHGIAPRVNGPTGCGCGNIGTVAIGCGSLIVNETSPQYRVKLNIYTIIHTYQGPGNYRIRSYDPNRNQDVKNIPGSLYVPFYIETMMIINPFTGANSSPVLTFAPIDRACIGKCFTHDPGAYDPDLKDSISFEITTSRGADGYTVPGYSYPNPGPGGVYGIDSRTGLLTWCSPQEQGEYNLAFIVKEWRLNTDRKYELIGYVLRDMQVIVGVCPNNDPPILVMPKDTCVEAGTLVEKSIIVKDPNTGNVVFVESGGGPFNSVPPVATISPTVNPVTTPAGYITTFQWQTSCDHIRNIPYVGVVKAFDDGQPDPSKLRLATYAAFQITVIPPAVKNVSATPEGSNMRITWTGTHCTSGSNPLVKYRVYRKADCSPFVHSPCELGVPIASGFELIGETGPGVSSFLDTNNDDGLVVGQSYSYLVVAVYQDGAQTVSSTLVCSKLKRNIPVILNVDVMSTARTGSVYIRWDLPVIGPDDLDPNAFPGPYKLELKHRSDSSAEASVVTFTSATLGGLPTEYIHQLVNTQAVSQHYVLEFSSGTVTIGESRRAGSVFLTVSPSDRRMDLTWTALTPWSNYKYIVHRKDPGSLNFQVIGTPTVASFSDTTGIANRHNYCYYITSEGMYSDTSIKHPLFNRSQQVCASAVDKTPPCPPTLTVEADCPQGFVNVTWNDVKKGCASGGKSDDVLWYNLYFKPTIADEYQKLTTFSHTAPAQYQADALPLIAGCYVITSVDSSGNVSPFSEPFCVDNCPIFELPNIFTPNDDGVNDNYRAVRVRQIKEIDLVIYDRWGNLVYKTRDPYFRWEGISIATKLPVSDGTFFYVCDVYEPRLSGTIKRTLKGYLQVAR